MNIGEIENFEKVFFQLQGLHTEIGLLSKGKPNDALNKFKLKLINQVLADANKILGERYKPFPDFYIFDEDELPTNSDVTFIISQYLGCMENLRVDNIEYNRQWMGKKNAATWYWKDTEIITHPPLNIKK